jgi:hypothetical protein
VFLFTALIHTCLWGTSCLPERKNCAVALDCLFLYVILSGHQAPPLLSGMFLKCLLQGHLSSSVSPWKDWPPITMDCSQVDTPPKTLLSTEKPQQSIMGHCRGWGPLKGTFGGEGDSLEVSESGWRTGSLEADLNCSSLLWSSGDKDEEG